jgi:hypothetical protein
MARVCAILGGQEAITRPLLEAVRIDHAAASGMGCEGFLDCRGYLEGFHH